MFLLHPHQYQRISLSRYSEDKKVRYLLHYSLKADIDIKKSLKDLCALPDIPCNSPKRKTNINDIPPYPLARIFEFCFVGVSEPDNTEAPAFLEPNTTPGPARLFLNPYILGAVCKYWRIVVFDKGFTTLWNSLWVYSGEDPIGHYGLYSSKNLPLREREAPLGFKREVFRWMKRASGNVDVHLTLGRGKSAEDVLNILQQQFDATIRSLEINAPGRHLNKFSSIVSKMHLYEPLPTKKDIRANKYNFWLRVKMSLFGNSNLRSLEELKLTFTEDSYIDSFCGIDLSAFPKLKRLTLVAPDADAMYGVGRTKSFITDNLIMNIPYSQITLLELAEISIPQGVARILLKRCPNLETCSLRHIEPVIPKDTRRVSGSVTLHNLKLFSVTFKDIRRTYSSVPHVVEFFEGIKTPAIESLALSGLKTREHILSDLVRILQLYKFTGGIEASPYSQLRSLEIAEEGMPQAVARTLLRRCPNLETCSLGCIERGTPSDISCVSRPIRLHNIKFFSVAFKTGWDWLDSPHISGFFKRMETPAIESLALSGLQSSEHSLPEIVQMVHGSEKTLRKVQLDDFTGRTKALDELGKAGVKVIVQNKSRY
ncbi:hypothetical protein H0H87_007035 [Tephrocybe sp. NHM501043]|nr:hypothetical protein H0H87_007035 [Tephrocybe sp. NHM501043]